MFKSLKRLISVVNVLAILILGVGGFLFFRSTQLKKSQSSGLVLGASESRQSETSSESSLSSKSEPIKAEKAELNTVFFGDVFWGRRMHTWSQNSSLKFAYPFSGLKSFQREKYDAWIADLECPVTANTLTTYQEEKLLKFNCRPEYLKEASKWFSAMTLANNHTDNMQEFNGLAETRKNLDNHGIQYFGHFDNAQTKDICEIVSFKARLSYSQQTTDEPKTAYIPIALCGFHNVFKLPLAREMKVISEYSKYLPTFVMPHQGVEYSTKADSLQVSYFRQMINLGADAVIGNHPHSVQNTEVYKNKLIVYSLGNFIFDQQFNNIVTQGIGVNLDMTFEYDENLEKWLAFSESCKKFKDNCLNQARQQNLSKPKFKIKYNLLASDNSGKLSKKASDSIYQAMLIRTNWKNTAAMLNK